MAKRTNPHGVEPDDGVPLPNHEGPHDDTGGGSGPTWVPPRASGPQGCVAARDDDFRRSYPILFDFLTLNGLGGKAREVGTLLLFAQDGKWKAMLNDKDGGNIAFHAADTVESLLGALDRGLKQGTLDWRESKKSWKK